MTTDAGKEEYRAPGKRVELPKLVSVTFQRVAYEPPEHRYFKSKLSEYDEAIEFRVETDRPLNLTMNETPVLFVGDTMLTEGEQVGKTTYTFLAFEKDELEPGAPLSIAYPSTPAEARPESKFRYEAPGSR